VDAPLYFFGADEKHHTTGLWNLLVFGLERVLFDLATDNLSCHCMIDSTFWLLTKQEQASETARLMLALLLGNETKCVPRSAVIPGHL
jgi:hypothetical protein